ncbi:acyltransferase family protein [Parasediminibacterium sp. JCM 36343]|uniref:acyltransferase family protein n=1 Tax=Parasediminibacterium sp. JCM 36343 TaxID=3374279 RepID=UPI003978477D
MSNPLVANKHLPQLNIIRAIASLAVAIFHLGGKAMPGFRYGWLGVEMFFVLTGFVICWSLPIRYSIKDFPVFFAKRLARVEPPYIVSIAIILALAYFVYKDTAHIQLQNVLFHLAYINNFFGNNYLSPVYWTLGIEFQFYILIGILFPFIFYSEKIAIVSLVLLNIFSFYSHLKYTTVFGVMPYFTFGMVVYMYKNKIIEKLAFFILSIINMGYLLYLMGFPGTVAAIIAVGIIVFLSTSNTIIDFFSKISFSLYLTHDIVGSQLVVFVGSLFYVKTIYTKALSFSIGLLAAICFAYLFYIIVEKKALAFSKRFRYAIR